MLKEMLASEYSSVFYESTHRIIKCLEELVKLQSTRRVVIGKELTKIYEEIISGTPEEILKIFEANKLKTKGEFVVMIV
jgi:16S rRNA (cytidine1402-2'-O)-methyltransferase